MRRSLGEVVAKWGEDYMVAVLIAIMSIAIISVSFYRRDNVDIAFALVGSWWSAIIAYYFTKKNGGSK